MMEKKGQSMGQGPVANILEQADALKEYLEEDGPASIEQLLVFMDTLKESIIALADGDLKAAGESMKRLTTIAASDLFRGIGEITRELHESIKDIRNFLEPILTTITEEDIQGLSAKLNHVSDLVRNTSERTLDLLFARQEIALADNVVYDKIARLIMADDKKGALAKIRELKSHNTELLGELMRISELQIHADLVDQIIKKVSRVMDNMEMRLVGLIRRYGHQACLNEMAPTRNEGSRLKGPVIPGRESGAVSTQDDVDSLLKSLGM